MNKTQIIIFLSLSWAAVLLCIVLHVIFINGGIVSGDIKGFAIDSQENLYIGVHNKILKLTEPDGQSDEIRISMMPDEYCFYIENDIIIMGNQKSQSVNQYDLQGEFIGNSTASYGEVKNKSSYRTLVSETGTVYSYLDYHRLKPAEIQRNGTAAYRMSNMDFLFSDLVFFFSLLFFGLCSLYFFVILLRNPEIQKYISDHKWS